MTTKQDTTDLGIFDASAFPTIEDVNSRQPATQSYLSPLTAIHQNIRRQNPVAAAAAATRAPVRSDMEDSTDPWESLTKNSPRSVEEETNVCVCQWMRRNSLAGPRTTPNPKPNVCSNCGKKKRRRRGSVHQKSPRLSAMKPPEHAVDLLETTPQLRVLTVESTDMQAAGHATRKNLLQRIWKNEGAASTTPDPGTMGMDEYKQSLIRDQANQRAASELASLLWVLAHEMSLEEYGAVESQVFTAVFALVHDERRMAGLAALDALLLAPSADEERKAIKFANTLSNGLRSAHGDFEFLSAVSKALGHMASRTANVDFVESEVTRALEWLGTERSDRR